jgi:acyl-CoA synthetase (AMP-forming)/AMP-acid ligase II
MFKTHLTVLGSSASLYSSSPAFKVPRFSARNETVQWQSITYRQFHDDVEIFARYWMRVLSVQGISRKSVVGLWYAHFCASVSIVLTVCYSRLGGMTYTDVLHIYGVSRAGFIPQLFSLRLPSPEVIFELMRKANAKALIFDASFESALHHSPVPVFLAANINTVDVANERLPKIPLISSGDDTVFIFHTSGSTSGSPKLVPCSYAWLNTIIDKTRQTSTPKLPGRRDVTVWMGSMCHIAQTFSQ